MDGRNGFESIAGPSFAVSITSSHAQAEITPSP
jgi:hypothetical protein